jgi:hypothetical protein
MPAVAAGSQLLVPAALADEAPNLLTHDFQIAVGTFGINSEPSVELRGETGGGDRLDFDREIDGGDEFRGRADVQWRFAERHKARFALFGLTQSKDRVLDRDIEWGDEVYPVDGMVAFSSDFWIEGSTQYLAPSIDEYDGNLQDDRVFLTWQPRKWVGAGVGYERFTVDVDVDKNNFNGSLAWT